MPPKKVDPKAEEVKKVIKNPAIKLEPEEVFHTRAKKFLDEGKKDLVEGKIWFNEVQTKLFFEGALDRDLLAEVWTPEIWEMLPKLHKEGVTEIIVDPTVAYKQALDRAIKIGMCYSYF